jgi:peptide/nickel transport system permease protein
MRPSALVEQDTRLRRPIRLPQLPRSLRGRPSALVGMIGLVIFVLVAAFAPLIAPYPPGKQSLANRLRPPAWVEGGSTQHLLGTDQLGRDLLSRLIYGSRVSLSVGVTAAALGGLLGVALGLVSGYWAGSLADTLFMRLADLQLSFPFLLLALVAMMVLGPGLINVILILGVTGWVVFARLVRGQVLSIRARNYVEAARALGGSDSYIVVKHVARNALGSSLALAALEVGRKISQEAALSFLGMGVPPPYPSWGGMLADGRAYIDSAWWVSTFPGLAIMLLILSVSQLGDWVAKAIDPQQK